MIQIRKTHRLVFLGEDKLLLETNPVRRIIFLICFLLLMATAILGYNPAAPAGAQSMVGFFIFAALTVVSGLTAAFRYFGVFDKSAKRLIFQFSFFRFFRFTIKQIELTGNSCIVKQEIAFLKGKTNPGKTEEKRGFFQSRSTLVKIFLDSGQSRKLLIDTTSIEEGESYAKVISGFLGVPCKIESL